MEKKLMNLDWWSEFVGSRLYEQEVLYEPSTNRIVEEMLELAQVNAADIVYDLGCGDGRIVIAAARLRGARGVGIDIDPVRIRECLANMAVPDTAEQVCFIEGDLYRFDFSRATVLTLYLLPEANLRLRPKIIRRLRPGSRVVSHSHDMGSWEPDRKSTIQGHPIYCWIVPDNAGGLWEWSSPSISGKKESVRLKLEQKFQKLRGALENGGSKSVIVGDPEIQGDHIRLKMVQKWRKKALTAYLDGTIGGDGISGRMLLRDESGLRRIPWRARRLVPGVIDLMD